MKVFYESRVVVEIEPGETGPALTYAREWRETRGAFPISTRMPLDTDRYGPADVLPWIANLLPESQQLEMVARATGASQADPLALLASIGRDTSGALSFARRGVARMTAREVPDEAALERIIEELPKKPFLVGEDGVSMSLAGVQSKIGVHLDDDGVISIPVEGAPTTWILKPDARNLPGGVYNEALCLRLASLVGLEAPEVRVGRAGARRYLLVKRYDRRQQGETWRRLHQEDMCQALGRLPSAKYEHNDTGTRGPTIRDIVGVMRSLDPLRGVLSVFDYVIFNTIACNTDAHAKNYSIMIKASGASLAPIYDVMCAKLWPEITRKQAMSLATTRDGDYFKGRHWQREAALCGLNPTAILRRVEGLCQAVLAQLPRAAEDVIAMEPEAEPWVREVEKFVAERSGFLINGLGQQDPDAGDWARARLAPTD
ncbi:serine/threonine-protein kinase HipA [Rhodovulum bhavnagarense]|uniref:Serine/threonine-protein kinase HipA n=1 Tax=Rhodovulum bhavnagarense TaxID=992286 RepID=A0A4R2RDC2_9RHOB|nr:HipA domain-containing protein [Rhodovulum bhavnagarense]TCP61450.1 serine/threonine-protein kinase HipA [Rhodovulum bhavnagarense]